MGGVADASPPGTPGPRRTAPTPTHSRRDTSMPNSRSAITVSSTRPPAITDCTSEIGASESAATCRPHDAIATTMPRTNQRLENRTATARSGRRQTIVSIDDAPRCL